MEGFETRQVGRTPLRLTVLGLAPELSGGTGSRSLEKRERRL
jgi:hypothetical protein